MMMIMGHGQAEGNDMKVVLLMLILIFQVNQVDQLNQVNQMKQAKHVIIRLSR